MTKNRFIQFCGIILMAEMSICTGNQGAEESWIDAAVDVYMEGTKQSCPQDSYWNERVAEALKTMITVRRGDEGELAELRYMHISAFRRNRLKDENGSTEEEKKLLMNDIQQGVCIQQADSGQLQIKCESKSYIVLPVGLRTLERSGLDYLREVCELYRCAWDMGSPKENQRDLHRYVWQTLCVKGSVAFFDGDGLTLIDGSIFFHYDKEKGTYAGWDTDPETRLAHYRCSEGERNALERELAACPRVTAPEVEPPAYHGEYDTDSEDDDEIPFGDEYIWAVDTDHLDYISDKEKALISRLNPKMKERLEKMGKLPRSEYNREMERYELDELTLRRLRGDLALNLIYRGKEYRVMPLDTGIVEGADYKYLYDQCLLYSYACSVRKALSKVTPTQQGEKEFIKVDGGIALYHQGYFTLIDGPAYFYYDRETGMYVGRETIGGGVTRYQCNEKETRQMEKFTITSRRWGEFLELSRALQGVTQQTLINDCPTAQFCVD